MASTFHDPVRHRPGFVLAGFLIALGAGSAFAAGHGGLGGPAAMGGFHSVSTGGPTGGAIGHLGFIGGGAAAIHGGMGGRFHGRARGKFRSRHRHHDDGFLPGAYYGYPYYDDVYGYDEEEQYTRRGSPHSGYCDVTSHSFPQFCVWKDGP